MAGQASTGLLPRALLLGLLVAATSELTVTEILAIPIQMKIASICATSGSTIKLECMARGATSALDLDFYRIGEDGSAAEKIESSEKFSVIRFAPNCRSTDGSSAHLVWDTNAALVLHSVGPDYAGTYGCGPRMAKDSVVMTDLAKATVLVQGHTEYDLSSDRETLNLTQDFSVDLILHCDVGGSVSVSRTSGSGEVTKLELREGPGQDLAPYVQASDGSIQIPSFACRDEGTYEVTYYANRGFQLVETRKTVQISACEGCCPKTSTAVRETPSPSPSPTPPTTPIPTSPTPAPNAGGVKSNRRDSFVQSNASSPNISAIALAVVCVLSLVGCACLLWQNRRLKKQIPVTRGSPQYAPDEIIPMGGKSAELCNGGIDSV